MSSSAARPRLRTTAPAPAALPPVSLAEGVRCPHCPHGVFRYRHRVRRGTDGRLRQTSTLRCDSGRLGRCVTSYDPGTLALGPDEVWAVHDGRVRAVRRQALHQQ